MNWKLRLQNKKFMVNLLLSLGLMIGSYFSLGASDLTTWGGILDIGIDIVLNPFIVGAIVYNIYNAFTDPTVLAESEVSKNKTNISQTAKDVIIDKGL